MSTGADCRFEEVKPGEWHYFLQVYPYGANEDYERFGPFPTFVKAMAHLGRNHANPGGYWVEALPGCPHDLLTPPSRFGNRVTRGCDRCGASIDVTPAPVMGASAE